MNENQTRKESNYSVIFRRKFRFHQSNNMLQRPTGQTQARPNRSSRTQTNALLHFQFAKLSIAGHSSCSLYIFPLGTFMKTCWWIEFVALLEFWCYNNSFLFFFFFRISIASNWHKKEANELNFSWSWKNALSERYSIADEELVLDKTMNCSKPSAMDLRACCLWLQRNRFYCKFVFNACAACARVLHLNTATAHNIVTCDWFNANVLFGSVSV